MSPHALVADSALCQQVEPSQPRKNVKLPVITGAAKRDAGDADADLDNEGAPSSSALPAPSGRGRARTAASLAGLLLITFRIACLQTRRH